VVGVQDEGDVKGALLRFRGPRPREHEQKIGGMRKRAVGLNHRLAFADAVVGSHNHGDLRGQADGFAHIGVMVVGFFVRVVEAEGGNGGAQQVHGQGVFRRLAQKVDDGGVQVTLGRKAEAQVLQLVACGQLAEPQQVADFLKVGVVGQFVDIKATVGQDAALAVYVTNAGGGGDNAFQSFGRMSSRQTGHRVLSHQKRRGTAVAHRPL
jgi:hypothetical protein